MKGRATVQTTESSDDQPPSKLKPMAGDGAHSMSSCPCMYGRRTLGMVMVPSLFW